MEPFDQKKIELRLQAEFAYHAETQGELIQSLMRELNPENKQNIDFIHYFIDLIDQDQIELPVIPAIATKILVLSQNKNASFYDYANLVKSDSVIALKVLKLANSPLYRGIRDVTDLELAISRVGLSGLKDIVMMLSFRMNIFNNKRFKDEIEDAWKHSLITALILSKLAYHYERSPSRYYTLGLLHNLGIIVLLNAIERYRCIYQIQNDFGSDFIKRLGYSFHPRLSAMTLSAWNFDIDEIEVVSNHHTPPTDGSTLGDKMLYLAQSTASSIETILNDYGMDNFFPYEFMINQAKLDIVPQLYACFCQEAIIHYEAMMEVI